MIKGHFYISLIKSIIRIVTCVAVSIISYYAVRNMTLLNFLNYIFLNFYIIATGFGVTEVLGVFEEIYDKRK